MAYVNKHTWEIVEEYIPEEENQYFECDELIAPAIRLLNLKGYTTENCCQSHPYPEYVNGYFASDKKIDMSFLIGIYYVEEAKNVPDMILEMYEEELKQGKKIFEHRCKIVGFAEAYISFAMGCEPPTIPEGWEMNKNINGEMIAKLSIDIPNDGDEWQFFGERLKVMKALKEWAENLPEKNSN